MEQRRLNLVEAGVERKASWPEVPTGRRTFCVRSYLGTYTEDLVLKDRLERGELLQFSGENGVAYIWKERETYRGTLIQDRRVIQEVKFWTAPELMDWWAYVAETVRG